MRTLRRNTQIVYYALLTAIENVTDDNGFITGEKRPIYGKPQKIRINVSPNKGNDYVAAFGTNTQYDRVMVTHRDLPIDEKTVLWIDNPITADYDYIVTRKAKSLNTTSYAISRVDVRNGY